MVDGGCLIMVAALICCCRVAKPQLVNLFSKEKSSARKSGISGPSQQVNLGSAKAWIQRSIDQSFSYPKVDGWIFLFLVINFSLEQRISASTGGYPTVTQRHSQRRTLNSATGSSGSHHSHHPDARSVVAVARLTSFSSSAAVHQEIMISHGLSIIVDEVFLLLCM